MVFNKFGQVVIKCVMLWYQWWVITVISGQINENKETLKTILPWISIKIIGVHLSNKSSMILS